jgi:hypothetical protein
MTITKCWQKGFKQFNTKEPENNCWIESLELIQEIQAVASSVATDQGIQGLIDIKGFIYPGEERIVDSEQEITSQIIAHYSLSDQDQESSSVEEEVINVSVSEAIVALNTLKLFQEQRDQQADQDLMAQLRKELYVLKAEKFNSQKQSNLTSWIKKGD